MCGAPPAAPDFKSTPPPWTLPPEEPPPGLGVVRRGDSVSTAPAPAHHSPLDATESLMRVTSGKSRVRESRLPGSVRAKPNGRATRPRSANLACQIGRVCRRMGDLKVSSKGSDMPNYFYSYDLQSIYPDPHRAFAAAAIQQNMTYVFTYNGHLYRLPSGTLWTLANDIHDAARIFDRALSDAVSHTRSSIMIDKRIIISDGSTFVSSTRNKAPEKNLMGQNNLFTCCAHQLHDRFFAY